MMNNRKLSLELELIRAYKHDFFTHTGKTLKCFFRKKNFQDVWKPSLQLIYAAVEEITPGYCLSDRSRVTELIDARKIYCMLTRLYGYKDDAAGELIKRDRTTIIGQYREGKKLYKTDESFRSQYLKVLTNLTTYENRPNYPTQTGVNTQPVLSPCL